MVQSSLIVIKADWMVARVCILLCSFFASTLSFAQLSILESISAKTGENSVEIDVTSQDSFRAKTQILTNPPRFVIDFSDAIFSPQTKLHLKADKLIGIRSAIKNKTDLRVVFDLEVSFSLQKPIGIIEKGNVYEQKWKLLFPKSVAAIPVAKQSNKNASEQIERAAKAAENTEKIRDIVIIIDAGHGGKDPGAISHLDIKEKDIVLSVAKRIGYLFKNLKGFKVILTRNSNKFVSLSQRRKLAKSHNADMFISIHADAAENKKARGASIYTFTSGGATSESARLLAQRENEKSRNESHVADYNLGDQDKDVDEVMIDFAASATLQRSQELGATLLQYFKKETALHKKTVERANFAVLKNVDIPSVLIELGFLTNTRDAKNLGWRKFRESLALQIFWGIQSYFAEHAPASTYTSQFPGVLHYKVSEGDFLGSIAEDYSLKTKNIIDQSNLRDSNRLSVGQIVSLPLK